MNFIKENTGLILLIVFLLTLFNFCFNVYFSLKDIKKEIREIHKIIDENNKESLFNFINHDIMIL